MKMKTKLQKYIVWSFCASEDQTFADILLAASPEEATDRVKKARPYATLDAFVPPMPLAGYIATLERQLKLADDTFRYIEQSATEEAEA